ncbi:MAG TPA: RsiV family protein [Vicinamibacteria bacterium]|nr:RsiV family protein [Vicinamibacteria bacterium]
MDNRFLPWLVFLVACEEPPAPPPEPKTLVFDMKAVENTVAGCTAGAPGCAYVRFDHATLVEIPPELLEGADAIVDAIEQFLSRPLREGQEGGSPPRLVERFMMEYPTRDDSSDAPWFLERKVFVIHNTPQAVTLSFSERSFLGDETARESFRYANFDPRTGERLTLTNVLVEGKLEELRLVAETRFREVRGLDANADLEAAGFRFEETRFTLTENFAVDANGLTFFYNPGEVAPYSLGPTEIRLSYDELNGLLSPRLGAD